MDGRLPGWKIMEGAGGGYIAFRTALVRTDNGLSNVRCGATLTELYEHLQQEIRRPPASGLPGPPEYSGMKSTGIAWQSLKR
ncbi:MULTISPECIES: hypothetical protein [unclassified Nonomuraea]|uniref:hypothetical protein n=1 Tax=unclassified Nonomuraea TaxID=2593643 RepID=UPI0013785901|nr:MULTISPECIES: hypothetical protein [unclassified Nonomuraea]NBE94314.1 hypothetical protein [Nonomuraea sp. K271]